MEKEFLIPMICSAVALLAFIGSGIRESNKTKQRQNVLIEEQNNLIEELIEKIKGD